MTASMKLQAGSSGVEYEGYDGQFVVCTSTEEGINAKDELYIFRYALEMCPGEWWSQLLKLSIGLTLPLPVRVYPLCQQCSAEKVCCGRECCLPSEEGIPLWLLILILLLVVGLICCLLLGLAYLCRKLYRGKNSTKSSNLVR
ncbi:unnamed protein product [Soboliphyme baturini]|uniref:CX domain-containing protein n=1 Tax=Soboliphyme baturini TaxID=241478 RepID=A0A183ISE1_9BILA|nr:unnamed protein product [Soboliphyme baturini]